MTASNVSQERGVGARTVGRRRHRGLGPMQRLHSSPAWASRTDSMLQKATDGWRRWLRAGGRRARCSTRPT